MHSIVVAFILGFIFTYLFGVKNTKDNNKDLTKVTSKASNSDTLKDEEMVSPLDGELLPLENVKDEAFASGALGNGLAIEP